VLRDRHARACRCTVRSRGADGAPSLACSSLNPDCVGVSTGSGGHRGGGHSGAGSSHGGTTAPDPCAPETGYSWTACHALGYVGLKMCVPLYEQYSNTLPLAQLNTLLTQNGCPARASNLPPSPATLAQRAAASFLLPSHLGIVRRAKRCCTRVIRSLT